MHQKAEIMIQAYLASAYIYNERPEKSGTYFRIRKKSFYLKAKTEIKLVMYNIVFISVLNYQITY